MSGETLSILLDGVENLSCQIDELKKEFYLLNQQKQEKIPFSLDRQFSILNLPSKGEFYKGNKSSLFVRYLTAIEENLLTDQNLMESGKGLGFVLDNVIIDNDILSSDLVLSDYQAVLLFLRSTAYGDNIDSKFICPHCNKEND